MDKSSIPAAGTFWRAKGTATGQLLPPLPFNPLADLDLPVYSLGEGQFFIDDRTVDYTARQQVAEAMRAALGILGLESNEAEGDEPQARDPNGIYLDIAAWPLDGKLISFNTHSGLVYQVQESTNLLDWSLYDTIVANDTNASFYLVDDAMRFFRVVQLDDRIQFPDWDDAVEQFVYFNVWTSIQGTYHLELYGDGNLVFSHDDAVPGDGMLGVYDGSYNPANWPNTGYYGVDVWELRVTVTPPQAGPPPGGGGAGGTPASATVQKKFRKPYASRRGLTVQQYNAFTTSYVFQDELDDFMLGYLLAGMEVTQQYTLQMAPLSRAIDRTHVPKLLSGDSSWSDFRFNIRHGGYSDLHYFGHGGENSLGSGGHTNRLEMWVLDRSPWLSTNRMRYVALDGCNTASDTTFLNAWVGYKKQVSRTKFVGNGWLGRFAWGWTKEKGVAYISQGTLLYNHFYFVEDYYSRLTHLDAFGYFDNTYKQAIDFAKDPQGQGVSKWINHNFEGDSINYVGCYDCYFDE